MTRYSASSRLRVEPILYPKAWGEQTLLGAKVRGLRGQPSLFIRRNDALCKAQGIESHRRASRRNFLSRRRSRTQGLRPLRRAFAHIAGEFFLVAFREPSLFRRGDLFFQFQKPRTFFLVYVMRNRTPYVLKLIQIILST